MQDVSEGALDAIFCIRCKKMSGYDKAVKEGDLVTYSLDCGHTFTVDLSASDWDIDANRPYKGVQ